MKKLKAFAIKHRNLWKAALMSLLPLLCCVVACARQGKTIGDVYLPAGEWNDELFYFKQVEGIVRYGYPLGYFGFNESFALKASFAAWSPVLVFPWILWGLLFGWNLSSPILCNIFLMMLAVFVFVWLAEPDKRQLGMLTVLFAVFTPVTRYMLSGMPECICFAMVIVVLALDLSYARKPHALKLALLFLLTGVMTLMRPYLLLFMLFPAYLAVKRKKWAGAALSLAVSGCAVALYALIKHYFGAAYFTPLFDVTWVTTFLESGVFAGVRYVLWRLRHQGAEYFRLLVQGIKSDLFWGEYFAAFSTVTAVLLVYTAGRWRKKARKEFSFFLHLCVCFLGMWAALLLMYKMQEGSKHLLTFTVAGIFAVSMMETKFFKKTAATAAVFAFLFIATGTDPYEHRIPYRTEDLMESGAYWRETFARECTLTRENVPNFDNVVIWVFNDKVGDGYELTPYQMLYQLPGGFGISCCYADYVKENIDCLQSRYLAVVSGGEIDALCGEKNMRRIAERDALIVYEIANDES